MMTEGKRRGGESVDNRRAALFMSTNFGTHKN